MTCKTRNAATMVVESEGGVKSGKFTEYVECANGHTGTVRGQAEDKDTWTKTGAVFQG